MIAQGLVKCFNFDVLSGLHTAADVYRAALYAPDASLVLDLTAYIADGEVVGAGYLAGGQTLAGYHVEQDDAAGTLTWADPMWPRSTISARGVLIYNASKGNRALAILDLGQTFNSTNGNFTVTLPKPALIRIGE